MFFQPVWPLLVGSGVFYLAGWLLGLLAAPNESASMGLEGVRTTPLAPTVGQIFSNNLMASMLLISGIVTLGLTTVVGLIINGFMAGYTVGLALTTMSPVQVLIGIVPHGVFEVPAAVGFGAVGFSTFTWVCRKISGHTLAPEFWSHITALGLISFLEIGLAAIIEGGLTSKLVP